MKLARCMFALAAFGSVLAIDVNCPVPWNPPGPDDVRGPCPFLNTLANHGFLPHSGKDIDRDTLVKGVNKGVGFEPAVVSNLFDLAISTNPEPNATTFSLDNLIRHNILEHDASLRYFNRQDAFFGRADILNQAVFNETRSHWTGDIIDMQIAVNALLARVETSKAMNPDFTLSFRASNFIFAENAAFIMVLGDRETMTVDKARVEYVFQNERFPYELGWTTPATLTADELLEGQDKIRDLAGRDLNTTAEKKREAPHIRGRWPTLLPIAAK
ncbi:Cloroperoxidase [Daldinia caldariorum]|uniref:Cloroperoxidase n=1 Tax=Daldinia caldariorum TaxID=326644 RepID=UPI00200897C3|nr:Cloroperoxidase [Daldinia caldariorum]KAI1463053.1 Cloroperoxidase [Daldinia caldariorum]